MEVPNDGGWSLSYFQRFYNSDFPRTYFFVAIDCTNNFNNDKAKRRIDIEFDITNESESGGSNQFSYEDQGLLSLTLFFLLAFMTLMAVNTYIYIQYRKTFNRYDSPLFVLLIALFMQMNGMGMRFVHLWVYSSNGRGIAFFDIFGLICLMIAEIGVSILLMLFAYGWTLTFQNIDWDNNLEVYLPVSSILIVIHLILAALTYIDVDAYHKYHDFSGVQGFVLLTLRLGLFGYYIYCFYVNKDKIPGRQLRIYRRFILLGFFQFMAVPSAVVMSYFFAPYNRQYFFTLATNAMQMVTATILLY